MHRRGDRIELWFPVSIAQGEQDVLAVSVNTSRSGILIASTRKLEPGTEVQVTFRVDQGQTDRTITGRVIRVEINENDPDGPWRHRVAIAFDVEVPELEGLLEETAARRSRPPEE